MLKINEKAIGQKLSRFRRGNSPRVLDLFSGCGGLSLGFHSAGFAISAAVEFDPHAALSHAKNFHAGDRLHGNARDITKVAPSELASELGLGDAESAFDVIVGGPPCQAFARVGRSKLREVDEHPEAYRHDPRARLYIQYLSYVDHCAPLAVVMENVPDMLNHGGHNIAGEVCDVLASRGYRCGYTLLNAAYYGVPQMRERMFLIAIRQELTDSVSFPAASHWIELPPGYDGSRAVALKLLNRSDSAGPDKYYRAAPEAQTHLDPAVTAEEALRDLPRIDARSLMASGQLKRGARKFDQVIPWTEHSKISEYGKLMRDWQGFERPKQLADHVIRFLPRDYPLFARLKPGDQYPEAHRAAKAMFEEELLKHRRGKGNRLKEGSIEWQELWDRFVPPYDPNKFPNKWRKMEADRPCRTLLAHLGKDSYSHIHYDSAQARTISVREAARLQSFPDGFAFAGTMNPAFRQIGNAVPPLLSLAIAESLLTQMQAGTKKARSAQLQLEWAR